MASFLSLELRTLTDDLSVLECSICLDTYKPPIRNCVEGHSFCGECCNGMNECPMCRKELSTSRNYPLENVLLNSNYSCKNYEMGCTETIPHKNLESHTKTCFYRAIKCEEKKTKSCNAIDLPFNQYRTHLIKVHKCIRLVQVGSDGVDMMWSLTFNDFYSRKWPFVILEFDGFTFLYQQNLLDNKLFCKIFALASEQEVKSQILTITFNNRNNEKPPVERKIPSTTFHNSQGNENVAIVEMEILKDILMSGQLKTNFKFSNV